MNSVTELSFNTLWTAPAKKTCISKHINKRIGLSNQQAKANALIRTFKKIWKQDLKKKKQETFIFQGVLFKRGPT